MKIRDDSMVPRAHPLTFRGFRTTCGVPEAALSFYPLRARIQPKPEKLDTSLQHRARVGHSFRRPAEFWENAMFLILGVSGFVAVAVSFL